jgi:hypothetical protein
MLEAMRSLQAEDPLIEAVRWRPTTDHGAGAETIQRLIEQLKRLRAPAGAPATPAPQPHTPMLYQISPGPRPEQAPARLPERIGRYSILARLGRGGMGTVYKAYDPQLQRVVAIKVPHFNWWWDLEELARQRFLREARAAVAVRHPNVCPIYDVAEHHGDPYVVMACAEGGSLADHGLACVHWPISSGQPSSGATEAYRQRRGRDHERQPWLRRQPRNVTSRSIFRVPRVRYAEPVPRF